MRCHQLSSHLEQLEWVEYCVSYRAANRCAANIGESARLGHPTTRAKAGLKSSRTGRPPRFRIFPLLNFLAGKATIFPLHYLTMTIHNMCHRAQRSQTLPQEVVPRGASGYCSSYKLLESIQRRSCPALSIADGWVDEKAWTCCLVAVSSGSKEVVQRSGRREEISLRGRTARIGRGLRAAMSSLPQRATVGYHPTHLLAHRLAVGAASSLEAEMLSQERGVGSPVEFDGMQVSRQHQSCLEFREKHSGTLHYDALSF